METKPRQATRADIHRHLGGILHAVDVLAQVKHGLVIDDLSNFIYMVVSIINCDSEQFESFEWSNKFNTWIFEI